MRIIYVITDLSLGGAELQLYKIAQKLRKDSDVKVISLLSKGDLGDDLIKLGVELSVVNFRKKRFFFYNFFKLCNLILDFKPDVVHCWMYHANLIGGIASKVSKVKKIIWSIHHNNPSNEFNSYSTILISKLGAFFSFFIPEKVICVSKDVLNTHVNFGYQEKKMVCIPNGIDILEFSKIDNARQLLLKKYNFADDVKLIGFPSRFHPVKNHEGFFASIAMIKRSNPNLDLQLILSGKNIDSNNTELITLINKYELTECVHLMGLLNDMPLFMSSIDLLVNYSYSEAFSLVLAEALACETLCISTIEGDPEHIIEGIGKYVTSGDDIGLSNTIINLLKMDILKEIKKKGREKIITLYSLNIVLKKYKSLYF